jgi:hypothetical protein
VFVVPGRILEIFLADRGIGETMNSERRALELAIELTPRAVSLPGETMDSEGRAIELTPRAVSLPGATMDSEGRALELAIELTPRAASLPGATMDSEGRALELARELTQKAVSSLPGVTMDSEWRALELAMESTVELTPREAPWMLGVVGRVALADTVIFEFVRDTKMEGSSAPGIAQRSFIFSEKVSGMRTEVFICRYKFDPNLCQDSNQNSPGNPLQVIHL